MNKTYESKNFRAEINCGYCFVRELDQNGMGGKVIDFNYSERKEKSKK